MSYSFEEYKKQLSDLRPDRSSGYAKPHKVCLLFAVMDLIGMGDIRSNRIYFDEQLKQQFTKRFNEFKHGNDKNDPSQPFFYLESCPFWHHFPKAGVEAEYYQRIKERKHGGPSVVSRIIEYAHLDEDLFQFMQSEITRPELETALYQNIEDFSKRFSRWASAVGKSEKTVKNYLGAINGSISSWAKEAGITEKKLTEINNVIDYRRLVEKAKRLERFQVSDSKGKGMYSAALKLYGDFLADSSSHRVEKDIEQIQHDPVLTDTEKSILVSTRIGQGQYRSRLIDLWGACAVTGYTDPRFLVASHIKPWRESNNRERLDAFNGLLLLPNLDKAFDLGYVSFAESGKMLLSPELERSEVLGVQSGMGVSLQKQHQDYLSYHREVVFRH